MTARTQATDGPRGTRQEVSALKGTTLLQSPEEWEARNAELAGSINRLVRAHLIRNTGRALDVGCMSGELTDRYGDGLGLDWFGIDPDIDEAAVTKTGARLSPGYGHALDFPQESFDCVTFANVYEHLPPSLRTATLAEIYRVLAPGGVLVGQLPNPFFPIESHSRLPFLGYLPRTLQRYYWRLTPTGWDFDKAHFFSVTAGQLRRTAGAVGLETVHVQNFNYSPDAIPRSLRWAARLHSRLGVLPWAWQFVFRKPRAARGAGTLASGSGLPSQEASSQSEV